MQSLDMLANNIANAGTSGYKADQEFYGLFASEDAGGPARQGGLPVIERPWTDFSQGLLQTTANPLDLALSGKGFFTVAGPSGPLYTRGGAFHVDTAGKLVTADGNALLTVEGSALKLDPSKPLEVTPEGWVRQDNQSVGRLQLADLGDPAGVVKVGRNYFRTSDAAAKPATASGVQVHQGKLENSNVSAAESAVRLVAVMRQFEMLQRAISLGTEMNRKALEEVARVGS
jgi:flagellar basal body rod protein FlgG